MALTRVEHWEARLHEFILAYTSEKFEFGVADCGLFAADGIKAVTGVDVAEEFALQHYNDEASARATIARITGKPRGDIEDAAEHIADKYDLARWPSALYAQRGDLILLSGEEGNAAGIVGTSGHAYFLSHRGLRKHHIKVCSKAWRTS